ncbi:hypothetical protein FQR65_LT02891 [Abscondita terminalis]|nr:hypothetical protein FQR65_LT02891 [Abscondita terminalis]
MVSMWSWTAGYDIMEMGDDISNCLDEKTLVIANHQSTADVPLLMALFNTKKQVLPNIMWIMDKHFKYTNFGIVSVIHEDFFIMAGKKYRDQSLSDLVSHLLSSYIPRKRKWTVLFPEGGFLRKRKAISQKYAAQNNLAVLNNVSLPRVGALQAIMQTIGPQGVANNNSKPVNDKINKVDRLSWVLDITIAYPNGEPLDLPTIILGHRRPCQTIMFYRLYRCDELPHDTEALTHWLYSRFEEKEKMLDSFYKTGSIPVNYHDVFHPDVDNPHLVQRIRVNSSDDGFTNDTQEDWSDYNISIPNPKPVISTYSPEYSIANFGEDDTVETISVNPENILTKFELDLKGNSSSEEFDSGCPNVHLSNSVLGPTTKQGCSDLNIAINTYLNNNQNPVPERLPTNDLEAASAGSGGQVIPPPGLAASAPAAALDTVADPVGASVNGPGPLGGLPSLPELPTLPNLPNLKGVLDLLRLLGTGLRFLWGALSRLGPLLYIIPIISFLFGFTTVLPFYPWWLPLFFFTGKSKEPPKTQYVVHKHVHKPIHHHDGSNQPQIGDTIKQLTNQLINVNASTSSQITLDTRTPPRVKQHIKKPPKKEEIVDEYENSHPGVAVPVHHSDMMWEESTKKLNFYKVENKQTTGQGISTWVLLNSQTVSPSFVTTVKSTPKPVIKHDNKNLTRNEIFNKITKPLFKKRPASSTTKKPNTTQIEETTQAVDQKLTKVKASVLSNAINNKTTTSSQKPQSILIESTTASTTTTNNNTHLSIEPKNDEVELLTTTMSTKKRRTTVTKKKKNKNRRRRPAQEKTAGNNTKVATKEKPIGTQIYNYLSREIMPTVGVGIVGLMVTAGLASYFLYPFGPVRRSYDVDRKDKEGAYYYNDEYSPGGISEEEAIGKVIAGMPNKSGGLNYPTQTVKGAYQNRKPNDFGLRRGGQSEASVEAIYLTPSQKYNDKTSFSRRKEPDLFNNQFAQQPFNQDVKNKNQLYGVSEVTPVVVPEHGPRHLPEATTSNNVITEQTKTRKRRSSDFDNEIFKDDETKPVSPPKTSAPIAKKPQTLMDAFGVLLETQIKIGLDFIQKATQAVASYFSKVNKRFNDKMDKERSRINLN